MTATTQSRTRPDLRPPVAAIIAAGSVATLLLFAGLYLDTPWKKTGNEEWAFTTADSSPADFLISLAFVAVGLAVVYRVLVSRGQRRPAETEARWALSLAAAGVLVAPFVYWTALPLILASGALVLALDARSRLGRTPATGWIVFLLATLTGIAAVVLALVG